METGKLARELLTSTVEMIEKKKVLLVLNTINDYRVETYNLINEAYDFTVGYNISDKTVKPCEFKKIKFNTKKIGPFTVFGKQFWTECKKYDAVITSFDIHNLEFAFVPFIKRRYKLLTWSIGLRCSYTRPYDVNRKHEFLDYISYLILKAADANIVYMEKARSFWANTKLDQRKIFVAPNTTSVIDSNTQEHKQSILFVGTLYKSKGVDKLITAYSEVFSNSSANITLDIVGKGDQSEELKELANKLGIANQVIFHGPIYDESKLAVLFRKSLVCVSPTQAGLTIPKSMGYGVPVITRSDAITGGEIYHINPDVNGIIYNDDSELAPILKDAVSNPSKYLEMGNEAKRYYNNHAKPEHQAQGVIDALNHVFTTKCSN